MLPRLLLALVMLVAACGDAAAPEAAPSPPVTDAAVAPEAAGEDAAEAPTVAAAQPATTAAPPATTSFDGPPATDFALPLENRDGTFVAVAGRSDLNRTREVAEQLGLDRVAWGYAEELWDSYGVRGQPTAYLITAEAKLFAGPWFRITDEPTIREGVEELLALGG